jgi:hypothetical protein
MLPYLADTAALGVETAIETRRYLARGLYTHAAVCRNLKLAEVWRA